MFLVAKASIEFQEPWCEFVPGQADVFLRELKSQAHPTMQFLRRTTVGFFTCI